MVYDIMRDKIGFATLFARANLMFDGAISWMRSISLIDGYNDFLLAILPIRS
ncbi:MAG: hypothetical protein GQ470_04995 [Gammaproteobacteria bacterium]|nr:hypothetical protein [Gammaproteobacteria bacterium]